MVIRITVIMQRYHRQKSTKTKGHNHVLHYYQHSQPIDGLVYHYLNGIIVYFDKK